jgi:nitrogen regulatory protein PII
MSLAATLASHRALVSAPVSRRASSSRREPAASRARGRGLCVRAGTLSPVKLDENVAFYQVRCMIRPWRLNDVFTALENFGIRGLTTYDIMGAGVQAGAVERYQGASFDENTHSLVAKKCIEVVLEREQVQDVVDCIVDAAQTGEIGDGKIFITPVADVVRIRTGEVGADAERMVGGRSSRTSA